MQIGTGITFTIPYTMGRLDFNANTTMGTFEQFAGNGMDHAQITNLNFSNVCYLTVNGWYQI